MKSKYDMFKNIKLEDTGLMKKSCKDVVYNRLQKNNIINLKELFELDDLDMIDYGKSNSFFNEIGSNVAQGVVKLLRVKYLNEDFIYMDVLELQKTDNIKISFNNKTYLYSFSNLAMLMGFTCNFAQALSSNKDHRRIIDLFESVYEGKTPICCNRPEYERNKKKIAIILENYYKNKYNIINKNITDLKKLKEKVLKLKEQENKRVEYMLARIQLEELINSNTEEKVYKK